MSVYGKEKKSKPVSGKFGWLLLGGRLVTGGRGTGLAERICRERRKGRG